MNIDLTEEETSVLSSLAGAGITTKMRQFAARINNLANIVPSSLNDILDGDISFFGEAVGELGSYNVLLMDLITLYEKIHGQTQTTTFYANHLNEIDMICDDMDTAQANGEI